MTDVATLSDLLSTWSAERPAHLALRFLAEGEEESARLTYRELEQSALGVAALVADHAGPRDRALLVFETSLHFVAALFGCFYADVIAVPVDPPHGRRAWEGIGKIAADCRPSVVLTTQALYRRWGDAFETFAKTVADRILLVDAPGGAPGGDLRRVLDPAQPAFLQYTSGSTGIPKGVMVTHRNLMTHLPMLHRAMTVSADSVLVSWLPLFHDLGLIAFVLQAVHAGCSLTLMSPTAFVKKPVRWLRAISRYGGTVSAGPDYAFRLCTEEVSDAELRGLDLGTWSLALNGAERVAARTLERFAERFGPCGFRAQALQPAYGMAEATLLISSRILSEPVRTVPVPEQGRYTYALPVEDGSADPVERVVSCGRRPAATEVRIADPETRREQPEGQIGEVWVRGPHVTAGYWQRPEESARVFRATLAESGEGPFLRTGDLGFLDGGELFLIGRLKEIIIIHGRNYAPQDVEEVAVLAHPALRMGHVVAGSAIRDDQEVLTIAAEIDREHWRSFDGDEVVRAILEAVSSSFGISVAHIALLRPVSLPKTTSGKLKRLECRRMLAAGEWEPLHEWVLSSSEASSSALEEPAEPPLEAGDHEERTDQILAWLCRHLAQSLDCQVEQIAIEEPFARYGLDSARAARLAEKLEGWLGTSVAPTAFWEHPHPLALAEHLAELSEQDVDRVEMPMV